MNGEKTMNEKPDYEDFIKALIGEDRDVQVEVVPLGSTNIDDLISKLAKSTYAYATETEKESGSSTNYEAIIQTYAKQAGIIDTNGKPICTPQGGIMHLESIVETLANALLAKNVDQLKYKLGQLVVFIDIIGGMTGLDINECIDIFGADVLRNGVEIIKDEANKLWL